MGLNAEFGNRSSPIGHPELNIKNVLEMLSSLPVSPLRIDPTSGGDSHFRYSMDQNITPYETEDFPYIIFFDEKTSVVLSDLASVINPFIQTETAKFITGIRNISEFDTYLQELKVLGFDDYLNYYRRAAGY